MGGGWRRRAHDEVHGYGTVLLQSHRVLLTDCGCFQLPLASWPTNFAHVKAMAFNYKK